MPLVPLPAEQGRQYALVFSAALRDRLCEVQSQYGSASFSVFPAGPLVDGRYYHCADILSEVGAGGIYAAGFGRLDVARFGEIEVVPMSEVAGLVAASDPPSE
jgi:hypothetical protein